jgi:hypothetical protein
MATAVDQAVTEVQAALAVARPQLKGLEFFLRLDQNDQTRGALEQRRVDTDRRIGVLQAALQALENLNADGYPVVPVLEVPDTVLIDLTNDLSVEEAALALFTSNRATELNPTAGVPEAK